MRGEPAALAGCTLAQLHTLAQLQEEGGQRVRRAALEAEVAAVAAEAEAASLLCGICLTEPRDCCLSCGHVTCRRCGERMTSCPLCRKPITARTRVFM